MLLFRDTIIHRWTHKLEHMPQQTVTEAFQKQLETLDWDALEPEGPQSGVTATLDGDRDGSGGENPFVGDQHLSFRDSGPRFRLTLTADTRSYSPTNKQISELRTETEDVGKVRIVGEDGQLPETDGRSGTRRLWKLTTGDEPDHGHVRRSEEVSPGDVLVVLPGPTYRYGSDDAVSYSPLGGDAHTEYEGATPGYDPVFEDIACPDYFTSGRSTTPTAVDVLVDCDAAQPVVDAVAGIHGILEDEGGWSPPTYRDIRLRVTESAIGVTVS